MNWDKKVVNFQHERGINAMQLGPAEAMAANRQARIIARWQREQLRTPEAIEQVAIHILSDDAELTPKEAVEDWGQMYEEPRRRYRERAAQHINALLGED